MTNADEDVFELTMLTLDRPPLTNLEYIHRHFCMNAPGLKRSIVEERLLEDGRYFALVWDVSADNTSSIAIWTGTVKGGKRSLSIKLHSENSGRSEIDCPPWLVDLAPPPSTEAAADWRTRCIERAQKKAGGIAYGSIFTFDRPVIFEDGHSCHAFRYVPGRSLDPGAAFRSIKNQKFYRIPHFLDRAHSVCEPPQKVWSVKPAATQAAVN